MSKKTEHSSDTQKKQHFFNTLTFLWLFGILASYSTAQVGIHTQKYNLLRLGAVGMVVTVPFGAKIVLPSEGEIRSSKFRSKKER